MSLKNIIYSILTSLYIKKNFLAFDGANFKNFTLKSIEPELLLLPYLLNHEEAFIDVGSNKGIFIHAASKQISPNNIFAFEPNPILYNKLKAVFNKVNLFQIALSSEVGKAILSIPFTNKQADDSLAFVNEKEINENAFNFDVELNTIDNVFANVPIKKIALIKIDVEGNEMKVLEGAAATIVKHRPTLIVEIEQRHHQPAINKLIEDITTKLSYTCFYYSAQKNKIIAFDGTTFEEQKLSDFGTFNYVNNFIFIAEEKSPDKLIAKINSEIEKSRQ
jgi:FkbM family methyltransferase